MRIDHILVEKEFRTWGPLNQRGRPMARRKGETYQAWLRALRSLGYTVDDRVLNAADYGDATTRRRLFVIASRGRRRPAWPAATHAQADSLLPDMQPWRPARDIIDWSIPSESLLARRKPLARTTIARIALGLRRFFGPSAEPFLALLRGAGENPPASTARSLEALEPPSAAGGERLAFCRPFIVALSHSRQDRRSSPSEAPLPTITSADAWGLVQPFLLPHRTFDNMAADPLDRPLRTITAHSADFGLVVPVLVPADGARRQAFLVSYNGASVIRSVDAPMPTITTRDRFGLVEIDGRRYLAELGFRMLRPHELAAAMSFPAGYQFSGPRRAQVKQIGNAVPVALAEALGRAILSQYAPPAAPAA